MMVCMRTNIVLNDALLREAMRYARSQTKKGLIEEALQAFIETRAAQERAVTYRDRLAAVQQKTGTLRLRQSAHEIIRSDRDGRR